MTEIKKHREIYKLSTKGKTLVWFREQDGSRYRTVSGHLNGKLTTSAWTEACSKNVGKKNETSPEEQAFLEIEADYKKKLSQGSYKETIEDISTSEFVKPMLAQPYYKITAGSNKIVDNRPTEEQVSNGEVWFQPKLDGVRCIITSKGMFTRQGKPIVGAPHIFDAIKHKFETNPGLILDGELYNHNLKDDFASIVSLVRKTKPSEEDLLNSKDLIYYYIYDLPSSKNSYSKRYIELNNLELTGIRVKTLFARQAEKLEDIDIWFNVFQRSGYEGLMVRLDAPYENKRSKHLLKYKKFDDEEFTILDVLEGEGNNAGMAAKIAVDVEGVTVYPNMTGTWEYCKEVLDNKEDYIGGEATVGYFGKTPDGSLRFPVIKTLYKNKRDV